MLVAEVEELIILLPQVVVDQVVEAPEVLEHRLIIHQPF
jgi:hypothetical protein